MRYRDENSNLRAHITTLRWFAGLCVLAIIGLWVGWQHAKESLRIYIPPDLRSGAVIKAEDAQPAHIYAFANTVFQQANHWDNGQADYGAKLYKVSPYLTPVYLDTLKTDMDLRGKNGELEGRTRTIQPLSINGFEDRRVAVLSDDAWVVWLDYNVREYVKGMEVKNVSIRYPLRVVRYDIDIDSNPWGLALDGYHGGGPQVLKAQQPLPELPGIAQTSAAGQPS
jgi:integrating conjugative element protein (TIGR03746 family)